MASVGREPGTRSPSPSPGLADRGPGSDENTPLLQDSSRMATHPTVPTPSVNGSHPTHRGEALGEEIDANDFDMLLSRSVPTSGGFLEPESYENAMLRGPRRYSLTSAQRPPKPSIPRLSVQDQESAANVSSASSPGHSREDEPLLPPASSDGQGRRRVGTEDDPDKTSRPSPYLNGISVSRFWLIFGGILSTNFVACFDGTIMASSHPVITSYFHSSNSASWLSTAFLLTSTAAQPLLGRLSDSLGRKPPYLFTMVVLALGTLWCACAGSMTSFILARAACGIGAGGMMTLGSIIVSDMVPIELRGTYQSYMNIIFGTGSALGAALGGAMADYLGWRWEFGIQVPPVLLCVAVASVSIPNDLGIVGEKLTVWEALKVFDFRGSLLLTTSLTAFVLGLNLGGNVLPWSHPFVIASLVVFAVCFPAFLYTQSLVERPIMPLSLIRRGPHANLILSNFLASLLMNAILFNIPLFFQAVLLTTATTSGLRLVLPSVVASAAGTATGFIITHTRRLKWSLVLGSALYLVGSSLLSQLHRGWPPILYLLVLVPHSLGQGFQFPGTLMSVLAASEQRDQAVVTTALILWRSLGTVLGVASSSLVVQNALIFFLERFVRGPRKWEVIGAVRESVEAIVELPAPYREQVVQSYEAALRLTFSCCAVLAFVSVCIVLPVRLPRLGERK